MKKLRTLLALLFTISTFGVSVQGMCYYIVVPGYGTQDYYFFNL